MNTEEVLTRHDEQIKTLFRMIEKQDEMCDSINKLATAMELQAQTQANSDKKLDTLSVDVTELKNRPAKRWETVVVGVLSAVVAALTTFTLASIGLN